MIRGSFALALMVIWLVSPLPASAQDMQDVKIETQDLGSGIYVLITGYGGNIGLSVGEDGVFMIDDQFAPLTDKILAAVAEVSDQPVEFLVNTHWHGDHTGGNENMGEAGALLVAHENVRKRMTAEQLQKALGDRKSPPSPSGALPVVTFTERMTFHWNGQAIEVIHVPHAHTDGDAIIIFPGANVIHMGDTFFNGLYPFIDVDTGGSCTGILAAVDLVLARADENTRIVPGHGPIGNREDLQTYRDMVATYVGRVQAAIDAGKTLEEIKAMKPGKEWDETHGYQFIQVEQMVEIVYRDLTENH